MSDDREIINIYFYIYGPEFFWAGLPDESTGDIRFSVENKNYVLSLEVFPNGYDREGSL